MCDKKMPNWMLKSPLSTNNFIITRLLSMKILAAMNNLEQSKKT